jgi:hypothetical protein
MKSVTLFGCLIETDSPLGDIGSYGSEIFRSLRLIEGSDRESGGSMVPNEVLSFSRVGRDIGLSRSGDGGKATVNELFRYDIEGVVSFVWRHGDGNIVYIPQNEYGRDSFVFWFLDFFMRCFTTIEDIFTVLSASTVSMEREGLLIAGPAGIGKSTLVKALTAAGYTMVSDDHSFCIDSAGGWISIPSHPLVWLDKSREKLETISDFVEYEKIRSVRLKRIVFPYRRDEKWGDVWRYRGREALEKVGDIVVNPLGISVDANMLGRIGKLISSTDIFGANLPEGDIGLSVSMLEKIVRGEV